MIDIKKISDKLEKAFQENDNDSNVIDFSSVVSSDRIQKTMHLNKFTLKKRKVKDIRKLKRFYIMYRLVCNLIETEKIKDNLHQWDKFLNEIEEEIQKGWNFPVDARYFKFWNRPKCTCPYYDNQDRYPHGNYIYNQDCPLHGVKEWRWC